MIDHQKTIDSRIIRIKLMDGTFVTGQINISRAPGYERVSDMVTENTERFLVLFSASLRHDSMEETIQYKTLFVNRDHILWAAPDEDQ